MARIKKGVTARHKHKKIMKLAKGFRGARSRTFRIANQSVMRALRTSYSHRKLRKRDFRRLWIARINAGARQNGMSYNRFINGLKKAGVGVNRKMLAELAIRDEQGFSELVEIAKNNL